MQNYLLALFSVIVASSDFRLTFPSLGYLYNKCFGVVKIEEIMELWNFFKSFLQVSVQWWSSCAGVQCFIQEIDCAARRSTYIQQCYAVQ